VEETENLCAGSVVAAAPNASVAPVRLEDMIVGDAPVMAALRRIVRQIAPSDAPVLLCGPSGCGKEVFARAIHAQSPRASRPFVAVNCGAIPRDLLESVLFGHEKGSFTGAHAQHKGRFEEAHGGTLFLDEIGDMPAEMQVKLLRVLEERAVQRVGGRGQISVDVRIVAATHRDIDAAMETGQFREDLFYRLAVFPIDIPALAERSGDIPLLIDHFLKQQPGRRQGVSFSPEAYGRMAEHGWPGNVRELRNFIDRANIMFAGRTIGADETGALLVRRGRVSAIETRALWAATELEAVAASADAQSVDEVVVPLRTRSPSAPPPQVKAGEPVALKDMLAEIERRYIEQALTVSGGVIADAARMLSLQRTTLIEKMRKYEMKAA
jgi:sigma-54 dependent transcriptional regulator, flagellar regulatory protein